MLSEKYHRVPIGQALDLNSAATIACDSINMKNVLKATLVFTFDTLAGASTTLELYSGATNAACTSTCYFNYAFGGAAIGTATAGSTTSCDVLAAWTNANTITITHTAYDNFMLIVEFDPACMDTANDEEWLTPQFTDPGGATGTVDVLAILTMRSNSNREGTVLA